MGKRNVVFYFFVAFLMWQYNFVKKIFSSIFYFCHFPHFIFLKTSSHLTLFCKKKARGNVSLCRRRYLLYLSDTGCSYLLVIRVSICRREFLQWLSYTEFIHLSVTRVFITLLTGWGGGGRPLSIAWSTFLCEAEGPFSLSLSVSIFMLQYLSVCDGIYFSVAIDIHISFCGRGEGFYLSLAGCI